VGRASLDPKSFAGIVKYVGVLSVAYLMLDTLQLRAVGCSPPVG
jgi:hypothetical protein